MRALPNVVGVICIEGRREALKLCVNVVEQGACDLCKMMLLDALLSHEVHDTRFCVCGKASIYSLLHQAGVRKAVACK